MTALDPQLRGELHMKGHAVHAHVVSISLPGLN